MTEASLLEKPVRVDEPQAAQEYGAVLTQVVAAGRLVIVRRNGEDLTRNAAALSIALACR